MNDRREPTISGLRAEGDDSKRSSRPSSSVETTNTSGRSATRPSSPRAQAPVRPIVVKSKLAPLAFLLAIAASSAAGYLYWQLTETQKALVGADNRLIALEESLKLADSESTGAVSDINNNLKDHFSEIDKLWAAYRKHKAGIAAAEKDAKSALSKANSADKKASSASSELKVVSDLVDAQQNALTRIEQNNVSVSNQSRALVEKNAKLEQELVQLRQSVSDTEKDIEAINGFRRSVNQQLLQLKGGAQ